MQDTFVQDVFWTRTGQTHFKQGQGQDIKQFGVDRGQREMAKIGDMEIDNSHDKGDMDK